MSHTALQKVTLAALLMGSVLAPAFSQAAADACVNVTVLDQTKEASVTTTTKRLVDYKANQVTIMTTMTSGTSNGGSSVSMNTTPFKHLDADSSARLHRERPAACPTIIQGAY